MLNNLEFLLNKFNIKGALYVWTWPECKKKYVAKKLIYDALQSGQLRSGQRIVEWSSGNLAKYVCSMAKKIKCPVTIIEGGKLKGKLPKWVTVFSPSEIIPDKQTDTKKELDTLIKNYAKSIDAFYLSQLNNEAHIKVYENLMDKIIDHLPYIDMYVEHIGSGATMIGLGKVLKQNYPKIKIIDNTLNSNAKNNIVFKIPFETYSFETKGIYRDRKQEICEILEKQFGIHKYEHGLKNILSALELLTQYPRQTVFTTIGD